MKEIAAGVYGMREEGPRAYPSTVRTDNALKVRFSATVGQEPEVEVALV